MSRKNLEIPVSKLPFDTGIGFVATVSEDGIAHITVSVDETGGKGTKGSAKNTGEDFLQKWRGTLNDRDSFQKKDHRNDPRMLHQIEKYGLDG